MIYLAKKLAFDCIEHFLILLVFIGLVTDLIEIFPADFIPYHYPSSQSSEGKPNTQGNQYGNGWHCRL